MTADVRPVPGPHRPATSTPPRRPGSVRRTSTIDTTFPDGLAGPALVDGRARDARTRHQGSVVVDEVHLRAELEPGNRLVAIEADPPVPGLAALIRTQVRGGFRRAVQDALPEEHASRSLLHLLLDDLVGATLVSGYSRVQRTPIPFSTSGRMQLDLCAGWAAEGSMMRAGAATGLVPTPQGPPAPAIEPTDDPLAWHSTAALPVDAMRRRRRVDLCGADVDVHFRDSYVGDHGETVLHEYAVRATLDAAGQRLLGLDAEALVLPWAECPNALASVGRVRGLRLDELEAVVRGELLGTSTCTHLNDTFRSLADLAAMVELLRA